MGGRRKGEPRRGGAPALDRGLRGNCLRFASAMSRILEKYSVPFEDDVVICMKTLTYDTPKGPKPWGGGRQTSPEIIDRPQSPNEEQSLVSCGKSLLDTGYNSDVESASINRHMERMHIKEDTSLATPAKNKYQVKMDILLEDSFHFGPTSLTVTRPKAKSAYQWSPLQKLGGHHDVVLKKQTESMKWQPASASLQLYNSAAPGLDSMTILPENQSLGGGNETVCSSFLEMYESADEHCSWGDITIGDLYPGMVKSLSRLLQKASREAASNSSIKRYKYGYWNPKKTKLNTSTDRVRLSRPLKQKSSLTIREDDSRGYQLSMANKGQICPLNDGSREMQCSMKKGTKVASSLDCNPEETFLVGSASYIPPLSNFGRKARTFEECSICTLDTGTTFNPAGDSKTEVSTRAFNAASCLNLPLNRGIRSVLQNNKYSPVKTSNRLPENREIKTFNKAVSLQRSHSFSSLPVNRSPIKTHQKYDDAFQKMYMELCCSKMRKPFKCSTICTSPRKSPELCKFDFKSLSSDFSQKHKNRIESMYPKLCSEGLPKIPTFMRAAYLKKYEGIPMSDTVNALVNSPVRTSPSVARNKRSADFCIEDSQTSPLKRLKHISGKKSPYQISQKLPYWKNEIQKTDMTFTLHPPNAKNWTSNMDSRICTSSNHTFLAVPSPCIKGTSQKLQVPSPLGLKEETRAESRVTSVQNSDSLRKSQNSTSRVSRKLSYDDGRIRRRNAYVEESLCEDYEMSFLDD